MEDFLAATITSIIDAAKNTVLKPLITLLIISATVIFIWGIIKYIASAQDSKKMSEAKQYILLGLVGLFVIVSMWGLVSIIQVTFNLGIGSDDTIPKASDLP